MRYDRIPPGRPKQPLSLTHKQRTILELSMQGYSTKEIAVKTGANYITTNCCYCYLLRRYNVRSNVSLITKIIKMGLIDPNKIEIQER